MGDDSNNLHEQIGEQLKKMRRACGLTQSEVGERLGISGSAVSLIEKGSSHASLDRLEEFADIVGGKLVTLVGDPADQRSMLIATLMAHIYAFDELQVETLEATVKLWVARLEGQEQGQGRA
jgi:transcriptional regulator with XRE-family HTH domain